MNTDGTVDTVELKRIGLVYCERSCTNDQLCKICVRWLSALKYHMYEIQINCSHSDISYKVFESVGWSNKLSTTKMCLNQTVINVYLFLPIQVPQHWNASSSDWPMAPRLPQSTTVNLQRKAKNREKRRKVESEKKKRSGAILQSLPPSLLLLNFLSSWVGCQQMKTSFYRENAFENIHKTKRTRKKGVREERSTWNFLRLQDSSLQPAPALLLSSKMLLHCN